MIVYKVELLEIGRFLVHKNEDVSYLVELDFFEKGSHGCGCDHYSKRSWHSPLKPCKHIRMVLAAISPR